MSLREDAMLILGDLVGFPTVTSEPNTDLIEYARSHLEANGADCHVIYDETGHKANLFATIGPSIDGGVVLSGHSDVVPADEPDWVGAPFMAMRRKQRIYGRGTADMKGFLACALAVAPHFSQLDLVRPLHIAITFDEEVGCRGMPILLAHLADSGLRPSAAIVGEPTGMTIVTSHKGCHEFTTTVTGLEGHGSAPHRGVNAVQFGVRYAAKLMELAAKLEADAPRSSPFDPPFTTINVGTMHGGSARNVVAGDCVLEWEMRPVSQSDSAWVREELAGFERSLLAEMNSVSPEAALTTVVEGAVGGLYVDENSEAIRLTKELLGTDVSHAVPFGTEAGLYQEAGIPAVVCGPGSIDVAHRPNEHIEIEQLEACLDLMNALGARLAKE